MPIRIESRPFSTAPDEWAHIDFTRRLRERLANLGSGRVCEFGGGARPALDLAFLREHRLECLVVDVAESELAKAPSGYATLVGDVSATSFAAGDHVGSYDLVFSRVLAEHVTDPRQLHINAHRLLRPSGVAMHFFPTLWWPPFVVNRLLPEAVSQTILLRVQPWRIDSGVAGKFPAYYRWCRGPTARTMARFVSAGFAVEECVAYFGESSHAPGAVLKKLNNLWTDYMVRHPNYLFTSYATYVLRAE